MHVGIPREVHRGERRVAATPQAVLRYVKAGFGVLVERGAGEAAGCSDAAYVEAGAEIVDDARELWQRSDLVAKVRGPEEHPALGVHEADLIREGGRLVCFIWPGQNRDLLGRLAARRATVLAMDCVPRITRAQKMDALSAMANVAGYRAVVEAAHHLPRFFAGQMTAAGRVEPAKVLVIGAGVAGLSAIGTARSLGAIVRAFDTRAATRDQVRSMGAEFLELHVEEEGEGGGGYGKEMSKAYVEAEMALFAAQAMEVDAIVTTALIPGKRAPVLVTAGMVESMRPGSVVVDLAAEQGGNCALTRPDEVVKHKGVTIVGFTDLPSRMASQSSQLYATTVLHLVEALGADLEPDLGDEVVRGALVAHKGEITWPPPRPEVEPVVATGRERSEPARHAPAAAATSKKPRSLQKAFWLGLAGVLLLLIGLTAPPALLSHLTVFVLACFVGWLVVWNVTPALHTPLMSITNAISGIIVIGGMLHLTGHDRGLPAALGMVAVLVATVNVAGGFLVTRRMLAMFRRHAPAGGSHP
ncbi:MAG: Re/Si-specific NAD(P)(+) transhydrogenase subunit alpha [Phycisphaeraceae bacterium]|nr:Re/Si-specific NAD(P)(+) transhydrogenase subunit alpha [Phycisphaeraceae bacterium]